MPPFGGINCEDGIAEGLRGEGNIHEFIAQETDHFAQQLDCEHRFEQGASLEHLHLQI